MKFPLTVTRDIEQPPGGWKFTVEQTGVHLTAASARTLRDKIKKHLQANSILLPEDFDQWADDAICGQMGIGSPYCGGSVERRTAKMPRLSLSVAARFLKCVIGVIKSRQLVDREEAQRRVTICDACPLATTIGGCRGCSSVFRQIERAMAKNPIAVDPEKEFCGACGCLIRAKVLIPNGTLDHCEGTDRPPYAEGCWRLPELPQ